MERRINFNTDEELFLKFKMKCSRERVSMREVLEAFISKWVKKDKETKNV